MRIVSFDIFDGLKIKSKFEDGKIVTTNFQNFLLKSKNLLITQFSNPERFKNVHLDEFGVLVWGDNGMDFDPEDIYFKKIK